MRGLVFIKSKRQILALNLVNNGQNKIEFM